MNVLKENFQLKNYNTFGLNSVARYFFEFDDLTKLKDLLSEPKFINTEKFILGGGSNVLLSEKVEKLILFPAFNEIITENETEDAILIKVGAGVVWDNFVQFCVENNYYGAENLSLIYGNVGASPVQNIGAYGVEAKDVIHSVEVFNLNTFEKFWLTNEQCKFDYRNSIFKQNPAFLVVSVIFKLSKIKHFNFAYADLAKHFENKQDVTINEVREKICEIRKQKLPDPKETGNAGSFFKNPIVPKNVVVQIKEKYPQVPIYKYSETHDKIAAGWLIEQCGWKGKKYENAAVHGKQALVIINSGNANASEIISLALEITSDVLKKFYIELKFEVISV